MDARSLKQIPLLLLAMAVIASSVALANPLPPVIEAWCDPCAGVCISPAGLAGSLASQGCVLHVRLLDGGSFPVQGFPREDIWWDDDTTGDLSFCPAGSIADADTDADGTTTLSGPAFGGGWTQAGVRVYAAGIPHDGAPLPVAVSSPDIDGNLLVELKDLADLAMDYHDPAYDFRSDFNHDGTENLGDIGIFVLHYRETCP